MSGDAFDFAIVGGGIAGLAAAYEILWVRPESSLVVLEAKERLGGNIRTTREEGFTIEWGVNGFLDNVPETLDLMARIGLADDLLPAARAAGRRFIFRDGRLREVPLKPARFLLSDLLTLRGRLRVLGEPFARPRPDGDETVFDFAGRRIGAEAAEILVDAMVSGVYAGDSRRLSLASTFPRMREMEDAHGSLVRAMIATRRKVQREAGVNGGGTEGSRGARSGAGEANRSSGGGPAGPGGVLTSLRGGMDLLITRLADRIGMGRIRLSAPVESVERLPSPGGYRLRTSGAGTTEGVLDARRVIVAVPARSAASFLESIDAGLAAELASVEYAPVVVVAFAYRGEDLAEIPDGFGFLAPHGQGLRLLGCLWDSSIFPPRAPEGAVLLRGMIGGACDRDAVHLSEEDLVGVMRRDLEVAMGLTAAPRRIWIFRHPLGIPQYTVGHEARLQRIAALLAPFPGLDLIGNSYRGVAVNHCAKEAAALARGIHDAVRAARADRPPTASPPIVPSRGAVG